MSAQRLTQLSQASAQTQLPDYSPDEHGVGIVHIGLGAFHKAHQAYYTDVALGQAGGDWKIAAVSLRSTQLAEQLNEQHGLFTLITRSDEQSTARIIGSIDSALSAKQSPDELMALLCDKSVRVVTVTVTEKGYGIDRHTQGVDLNDPVIAADLETPSSPSGLIGYLVQALDLRRQQNTPPFTVLSCDNLPLNGQFLRAGVLDFASRTNPTLCQWIATQVAFPCSMVDRITPAPTPETHKLATELTSTTDLAAVTSEPFHQWVIEDHFPTGRPAWELAGAIFTDDVSAFETMKLRMLNGAHSMMAYAGHLSGHRYIRDVMKDDVLVQLVRQHMQHSALSVNAPQGIDLAVYADQLADRFTNTAIAHETIQIAMDGSQKMPQRIFEPCLDAIKHNRSIRPFALATALWIRFCSGKTDAGETYPVNDPLSDALMAAVTDSESTKTKVAAVHQLIGVVPDELANNSLWHSTLVEIVDSLFVNGVEMTLRDEAQRCQ